jgi:hypothetical protein
MSSKLIAAGVLFLIALVSGIFLSRGGRPLNAAIFGLHKIVALVTVVLLVVVSVQLYKSGGTQAALELGAMILTSVFLLALFVSGALLSFERSLPALAVAIHKVAPALALVSTIVTLILLVKRQA